MHSSIRVLHRIEPRNPLLVASWPGMGNVAYGAAMYLKESVKASKFAEIKPEDFFYKTGVQIGNGIVEIPGLPRSEFFFYEDPDAKSDLLIFIGESQPVMEKEYELAKRVIEVALEFNVREAITFAATPVNITHHAQPGVWGVSTEARFLKIFPRYNIKVMNAGHIGGLNGLVLGVAKEAGIGGFCLLGEIPFYTAKIENPKSSLALLKVFMEYSGVRIDLDGLGQMAVFVEEEIDKVSKTSKQTLLGGEVPQEMSGASEAEYEEGEQSQAQGEKVPHGIRDRIEYMFKAASEDISKAGALKAELDRWGLFQEYEDRFLDLFGKKNL